MSAEATDTAVELMPTLQEVSASADSLILDPNNPRFLTQNDDRTEEDHFLDPGVIEATLEKMKQEDDGYRIGELEKSILKNGWEPVDRIFVRRYRDTDYFVVLEGNRRVTAVRNLLKLADLDSELREKISTLKVMEVVDDCGPDLLYTRISYLLGVRHHGSLKQWSPFAQAHNIYERYLVLSGQSDESFQWCNDVGKQVADALSIDLDKVKERLTVYRVMKQIDDLSAVAAIGGMKARYYSICRAALLKSGKSKLPDYIKQDPVTMLLDDVSLERMDNVCHFSTAGREGAPMWTPPEWTKFDRILRDDDEQRRTEMIEQVEARKHRPSDVWAEREVELHRPRWETWLREVSLILAGVQFGDDLDSPEAKAVGTRLGKLLAELQPAITAKKGA